MITNKRQRTDQGHHVPTHTNPAAALSAARTPKLSLSAELATKLGTRYCNEEELLMLLLKNPSVCSKIMVPTISRATNGALELIVRSSFCSALF
jgi:hypothetical protein